MKKTITILVSVLLIAVAAIAIYRFGVRKSIPEGTDAEKVHAILVQNDCFVCHSANPKLPFYASFPVIGKMMQKHIKNACDFVDLEKEDLNNISEVGLAMIEQEIDEDEMPILEYKMIHWGTGFNHKEKGVLTRWAQSQRMERFNDGLAFGKFALEPVRPLPDFIPTDSVKVDLGRRMFFDGRISLDGTISCASCHLIEEGGADVEEERVSTGINDLKGGVNAPTVYNAYYNIQQFWNGRAATLATQAAGPPVNPVEMGDQTWDDIVARLKKDKELVREFNALYPGQGITEETVTDAIAEFEKTLITPDSRFDQYLKGAKHALTEEELEGYEEFKENACVTCHTGIILGGQSFARTGIFADYFAERTKDIEYNTDDEGLKGFTGNESDLHKFKVPGLRNVALTAPYFHDGSMKTLEDAVRAMAKYELGKTLDEDDVREIVAFMKTLTGKNQWLQRK